LWLARKKEGKRSDLYDADLRGAYLRGADLRGAKGIDTLLQATLLACPQEGSFTAWKACREKVLVKLLVPEDASRSSATARKCRASHVVVLDVENGEVGISKHDSNTIYKTGETVRCDHWDEDRWNECSGGIHFFLTKEEAQAWS
jgi:hypothetical protein